MNSDLIQRMEEARKGLQLACKTDLFSGNEGAKLVLQSMANQIGMWQSEIMHLERKLAALKRDEDYWQKAYRDDIGG